MGLLDETVSVPRRTMTLFFLIDTSGSMEGNKIGAVNDAVVNVLPMLNDISETNPDAEIKVAALEFSNGVNWLYDEPKLAKDFIWQDVAASGLTSLGAACSELASKLSRSGGFMQSASGSFAPAIILLSDGGPTDDYNTGLAKLKANNWFKSAIKIAIAIGDDADKDVLKDFTGSSEAVITVHNIDALKQIIRVVAVTSSQIGSKSSTAGETTKQEQVVKDIQDATQNIDGAESSDSTSTVDSSQYIDDWG
ncbi:MAG: VWA domain-containing protein [Prevotella sp.]|uniref:vWA domain-containing protein n=1 Tax=Prevotella sp. TaxID=59823 RepID=UPI002A34A93A|nr:VWA domain-containing protein [Prevotella sp.]MDD7318794.1 VWA domain-containing protein [Prevotellaceae bacterium]MDY4019570.1 VWA domain-containing protein [Prevotella sp.]